jgi:hypothetical protein
MKAVLVLEDTPEGIKAEARWAGSGMNDNHTTSIAMWTLGNLTKYMQNLAKTGGVRVVMKENV